MNIGSDHFDPAATGESREDSRKFNCAVDRLTSAIFFGSEQKAILPENVETTKGAFRAFCDEMDWPLARWNFEALIEEKTGEFEFRADGKTPNWYHEFRQSLYWLSFVREGLIKEKDVIPHGGSQVAVATALRHDSWEDLGKDRLAVYAPMERRLHEWHDAEKIDDAGLFGLRQKAVQITNGMDFLTRKFPRLNDDGSYARKPNGKFIKDDRFGNQITLYYDHVLKNPFSTFGKLLDGVEGLGTRDAFDLQANITYALERRMLFGTRRFDLEGKTKYPFLAPAIESADAMIGVLLMKLETSNYYDQLNGQNPRHARPIEIERYSQANKGFRSVPPGWHPIGIAVERDRIRAKTDPHTNLLLNNAFLPALRPLFPQLNAYPLIDDLPKSSAPASNLG